jgi:hypothetical protein
MAALADAPLVTLLLLLLLLLLLGRCMYLGVS